MVRQRDGSVVPSLASEHLLEVELLRGTERQLAEEVVENTLGSIFQGEFVRAQPAWRLRRGSAGSDTVRTLPTPVALLLV
jgi:hypothetical protein